MTLSTDVLIIGGGIAGAGAAYEIAAFASVTVLEREHQCGYHSTGRSAASFSENYGTSTVRRLAMASRTFFEDPPSGFCEYALLAPRPTITIARQDQLELLEAQLAVANARVPTVVKMDAAAAVARVPILRPEYVAGAVIEPDSQDLDVSALHQGFLRAAKARGATISLNAEVQSIERRGQQWLVGTPNGAFASPIIINAGGAWADAVAAMAGIAPLGLVPKRRTAFNVPAPPGMDIRAWPMVDDVGEEFYFKPDAGQLFISPADATPSEAVDAQPDDLDVARGVERFEGATTVNVNRVSRAWAGLRTFASDGSPVVGPDSTADGFLWLAGQGGYGIQTAPALSRACAALLRDGRLPDDLARLGISTADLSSDRLRQCATHPASSGCGGIPSST